VGQAEKSDANLFGGFDGAKRRSGGGGTAEPLAENI